MSNVFSPLRALLSRMLSTRSGKLIGIVILLTSLSLVIVQVQQVQNLRQEAASPLIAPIDDTPVTKKVLLLVFNPIIESSNNQKLTAVKSWQNPDLITEQLIPILRDASNNYVNYEVEERQEIDGWPAKSDGFVYTDATYLQCLQGDHSSCHSPDIINYQKLIADYNVCSKNVDEVWLWGGPWFGYHEFEPVTYCRKTQFVMGFNYERALDEALHDFGHRMEFVNEKRINNGIAWKQNTATEWNKFSKIDTGCGNIHNPPGPYDYTFVNEDGSLGRAVQGGYNYSSTNQVTTTCDSYLNYPSDFTEQTITCAAWGCTQRGFVQWWLTRVPHNPGTTVDQQTGRTIYNNWWKYYAFFDETYESRPTSAPSPTPAPSNFSEVDGVLGATTATYTFKDSGQSSNYIIDMSTRADMSTDVYLNFGVGQRSPITVASPQGKWDKYRCGARLYWRVSNANKTIKSSIQTSVVCAVPTVTITPSPTVTPTATSTPSPTNTPSPTPTNTPTPTVTPTPTNTPTLTPTPTRRPTPTPKPDKTKPKAQFIFPLNGIVVAKGKGVTMLAHATDNKGVASMTFYVNDVKKCVVTSVSEGLYKCSWTVPGTTGVTYSLKATAADAAGNTTSSTIKVTAK